MRAARACSTLIFCFFAAFSIPERNRSVSNGPGRRKLIVTFLSATVRATPARNAVKPARAPEERSRPGRGAFTDDDVMLTMRPNLRAAMPSMVFWISSIATIMLPTTPSIICWRVSSRKSFSGGPPLLLTRMSGSAQAAKSCFWPSGVATSAITGVIFAPVLPSAAAASLSFFSSRPLITTSHPASANALAQPKPSPRLEAQTMALRPAIPRSMNALLKSCYARPACRA